MPFKPGESGNPGGRPKKPNQAAGMAREHTEAAILRLVKAMGSDDDTAAIKAANSLLERAWGKPQEFLEVSADPETLPDANLIRRLMGMVPTAELERLAMEAEVSLEQGVTTH